MSFEIKKAVRRALPLQIGWYGPSGSGKTLSALLFGAGLTDGKVVVIDTERGRASLYADNKRLLAALPQGYDVLELNNPYHPDRFAEAIRYCQSQGYSVCIIDSESDSWDGPGGCHDITEANKGRWNKAKLANKKFKMTVNLSSMHVISLFKAQEKSKIIDKKDSDDGKEKVINLGILPISERNAFYPMLLGFAVDPETHLSRAVKCHDDLWSLFQTPKLISKEDGEKVRRWNDSGVAVDQAERIIAQSRDAAESGLEAYRMFFDGLTPKQKKQIPEATHAENKKTAADVDKRRASKADDADEIPSFGTIDNHVP